jgi:hypothetical protein
MTGGAVDIEALLAALEKRLGDRKWKLSDWVVTLFSGVEARVFVQMAARDGTGDQWARSAAVFEEAAAR